MSSPVFDSDRFRDFFGTAEMRAITSDAGFAKSPALGSRCCPSYVTDDPLASDTGPRGARALRGKVR